MKIEFKNNLKYVLATLGLLASIHTYAATGKLYPEQRGVSTYLFDSFGTPNGSYSVSDYSPNNLDTYKSWNFNEYQIEVELPITRYIPDLQKSIDLGAVSKTVDIYIPAYDVDSENGVQLDCDRDGTPDELHEEVNKVYLNDNYIGTLKGKNNEWKLNKFAVPIESINLPKYVGDIAINKVSIQIDSANKDVLLSGGNRGCTTWGTSIDWVSMKIKSADPIFILAGLMGETDSLDENLYSQNIVNTTGVYSKIFGHKIGTLSNKRCRPDKLEALEDQANQFIGQIKLAAYGLGTARFNLIGYSMGGLASRMIYNNLESYDAIQVNTMDNMPVYEKLSIESLLTIGSPHQGTLVADIIERTAVSLLYQDTCELRTFVMKSPLNPLNQVPLKIPVAMIASDADKNGNGRIEEEENTPGSLDLRLAKFTYWALYNYDYIDLNLSKQVNQYFENYILPENLL